MSTLTFLLLLLSFYSFSPPATASVSDDLIWDGGGGDSLWMTPANWQGDTLPPHDADVIIDAGFYVIFNGEDYTVESVRLANGAHLHIAVGHILRTTKGAANGSDGMRLESDSGQTTQLTIAGELSIGMADAPGDAVDINKHCQVEVLPSGKLTILDAGNDGIEINETLINGGIITIANTTSSGIKSTGSPAGDGMIHNLPDGVISFTNVTNKEINLSGNIPFYNEGTIHIVGQSDVINYSDGEPFINTGHFHASGMVNSLYFEHGPGGIIDVATPSGILAFDDSTDFSNNTLSFHIEGTEPGMGYTQIQIEEGGLTLSNTLLTAEGSYTPQLGETFLLVDKQGSGPITGHLTDLPEGAGLILNGTLLTLTYQGGDGNDLSLTATLLGLTDEDEDGYFSHEDCDDTNANINPGALEIPYNGIDEDCDESTPDDDLDGDGFLLADDCNDDNPDINPDAEDIPNNGVDEDCDEEDALVSGKEVKEKENMIFPNPTNSKITVVLSEPTSARVVVSSISGSILLRQNCQQETILNLSHLANGVYILSVETEEAVWVERLIKM